MDIQSQKSQLREDIRHRLKGLSDKERAAESRSLCRRLLEVLPKEGAVIAAFASLRTEPNIWPLLLQLLINGTSLFLPRVEGGTIVFRRLASSPSGASGFQYTSILKTSDASSGEVVKVPAFRELQMGAFNILEPPVNAPPLDPLSLQIALIPGVAFDRAGNRLGRGNGGYDHWIKMQRQASLDGLGMTKTQFWGISFECQLVQEVPVDLHDEPVDAVITARGLTRIKN